MRIFYGLSILINIAVFFSADSYGQSSVTILPIVPGLLSNDHTSEGFMVTLSNGNILHIFRLDPGTNGDHTGNSGRIAKRSSTNGGLAWSQVDTIYDDQYDDRNINGGILSNGRIVVTFRRYNASSSLHIDYNLIYSGDGGNTWSSRQMIISNGYDSDTQKNLPYVPSKGYMNVINQTYYVELRFSNDGINWSNPGYIWDYTTSHQFLINESCFTYTTNGKLIGLMRNDTAIMGANYYQVSSGDYGNTWSQPVHTNIANGYFCPSPLIFYDQVHDDVWAIACDRRNNPNHTNINSRIYIYRSKPDSIYQNPTNWTLVDSLLRPFPNRYRFYGYPCVTQKQNGNYLVVFTESYHTNHEGANFYQFEIVYNSGSSIIDDKTAFSKQLYQNYPNPSKFITTIEYYIPANYNKKMVGINFYDQRGQLIYKFTNSAFLSGNNSFDIDVTNFKNGLYFYCFDDAYINEKKKMLVLK
jgi:hypothetical protein